VANLLDTHAGIVLRETRKLIAFAVKQAMRMFYMNIKRPLLPISASILHVCSLPGGSMAGVGGGVSARERRRGQGPARLQPLI